MFLSCLGRQWISYRWGSFPVVDKYWIMSSPQFSLKNLENSELNIEMYVFVELPNNKNISKYNWLSHANISLIMSIIKNQNRITHCDYIQSFNRCCQFWLCLSMNCLVRVGGPTTKKYRSTRSFNWQVYMAERCTIKFRRSCLDWSLLSSKSVEVGAMSESANWG